MGQLFQRHMPILLAQANARCTPTEGDGAKRSLVCSLCCTEWEYRRIVCPSCGEEDMSQLPIYTAADLEHLWAAEKGYTRLQENLLGT